MPRSVGLAPAICMKRECICCILFGSAGRGAAISLANFAASTIFASHYELIAGVFGLSQRILLILFHDKFPAIQNKLLARQLTTKTPDQ